MKIHFIGIGGIGISALAKHHLSKGAEVYGSDLFSSEITQELAQAGAKIKIGPHKGENIPKGTSLVVCSPAVQPSNPEYQEAQKQKIKIQTYPEALGDLTKDFFTVAVSGTHGKSTTTAMISLILIKGGLDPTVIIGTKMKEFGDSNYRPGKSKYLLIEADEYAASFLNYWPKIIALTSIDADHLDYYKNLDNIISTFKKYILRLPKDGVLVANADDKNVAKILPKGQKTVKFSLKQTEAKTLAKILKIPGQHILSDALAALSVARLLNIPDEVSFKALSEYKGAWRRFETIQEKPFTIISDYGHNPVKALAGMESARQKYPKKKIICVYQPHQYQRTHYLFDEFVEAFKQAPVDKLIVTDIYDVAGREEAKISQKVSSKQLAEAVKKPSVIYLPIEKVVAYLKNNLKPGQVLIVMGAGDIYNILPELTG